MLRWQIAWAATCSVRSTPVAGTGLFWACTLAVDGGPSRGLDGRAQIALAATATCGVRVRFTEPLGLPPGRSELVERKHRLEGEINVLRSELRRCQGRGQNTADLERRLARAQQQHFQARLDIDRTAPD